MSVVRHTRAGLDPFWLAVSIDDETLGFIQSSEKDTYIPMILSFHPMYVGDNNILCAGRDPGPEDLKCIQEARAVILPQGCRKTLYDMARNHCSHVFPDYHTRFKYPGKTGQIQLFRETKTPHPKTQTYEHMESFFSQGITPSNPPLNYPFVFKFDWGGEGDTVFLIDSDKALSEIIEKAKDYERTGQNGFLLQEYIPSQGRSLRVVVIGNQYITYWRKSDQKNEFYSNLTKGAHIDKTDDPEKQKIAVSEAKEFCEKTNINLAGFDFLFSENENVAYFLEINYFFGRKGLGGSDRYYTLLLQQIEEWIKRIEP